MGLPDVARVLDVVYRFDLEARDWLREIGHVVMASIADGKGVACVGAIVREDGDAYTPTTLFPAELGTGDLMSAAFQGPVADTVRRAGPVTLWSRLFPDGDHGFAERVRARRRALPRNYDVVNIFGRNPGDSVCAVGIITATRIATPPNEWARVAIHLAAATRLRLRGLGSPQAIFEPNGRLKHAEGVVRDPEARAALRRAVRAIDRVRAAKVTDAAEALDAWSALVARRYSLVDSFESDGRRFVVAVDNHPATTRFAPLTPRESIIAALVALGLTNKAIGYALGVAPATVATHVASACRKLACPSRAALASSVDARTGAHEGPAPGEKQRVSKE